jgi:hypothetical protein
MTRSWFVTLPGDFNRRVEDGALCFWRPGLTVWVVVWNNDRDESPQKRLDGLRDDTSPAAYDHEVEQDGGVLRFAYRLREETGDDRAPAFYCFAIGRDGHVQMAVYFDHEADVDKGRAIWRSLDECPPE